MNINLESHEFLKEQHIQICIVCRGGMITTATFDSFIKWTEIANQIGVGYTVNTIRDSAEEKNAISKYTLSTPGPTHMLFIDADMEFAPHHILALLSAKKHVIGAGLDHDSHQYLIYAEEDDLASVTEVPSSFLMLSREALVHFDGTPFNGTCWRWRDLGGHVWSHNLVTPKRT